MKTTHVGSLPFKTVAEALDYTFLWDVPVLFSLPQMRSQEFMGRDLLTMLGVEATRSLDKAFYKSKRELIPFHLKEFLRFREEKKNGSLFKYQLIGPVTFYQMLPNKNEIDFNFLKDFLLEKYIRLIEKLAVHGDIFFVLDEPMLGSHISFYSDKIYLNELSKVCKHSYIHCCDKLDLSTLEKIKSSLHLDMKLYPELLSSGELANEFIGLDKLSDLKFSDKSKFISPSCGLGIKKPSEILELPSEFSQSSKSSKLTSPEI